LRVSIADRAERTRLVLQIERDLVTEARLRTLLTAAQTTLATHRRELRTLERRFSHTRRV